MNVVDLPPQAYSIVRIVREVDFDPYNGAFALFGLGAADDSAFASFAVTSAHYLYPLKLYRTSSSPEQTINSARSIGSPWRVHTSSNSIDHAINESWSDPTPAFDVPAQLAEIRRLTGYGWEKIAELIGCSRQSVHNWTIGGSISDANRDRLAKLHAALLYIDRGDAEANVELLSSPYNGRIIFDLLVSGEFDNVRAVAGPGGGRPAARWGLVIRDELPHEDHWFARILDDNTFEDDDSLRRAKPQKFKRLRLRKG